MKKKKAERFQLYSRPLQYGYRYRNVKMKYKDNFRSMVTSTKQLSFFFIFWYNTFLIIPTAIAMDKLHQFSKTSGARRAKGIL